MEPPRHEKIWFSSFLFCFLRSVVLFEYRSNRYILMLIRRFFGLIFLCLFYGFSDGLDVEKRFIHSPIDSNLGITLRKYGDVVFEMLAPTEKPQVAAKPADIKVKSNMVRINSVLKTQIAEKQGFDFEVGPDAPGSHPKEEPVIIPVISGTTERPETFFRPSIMHPKVPEFPKFSRVHGEVQPQVQPRPAGSKVVQAWMTHAPIKPRVTTPISIITRARTTKTFGIQASVKIQTTTRATNIVPSRTTISWAPRVLQGQQFTARPPFVTQTRAPMPPQIHQFFRPESTTKRPFVFATTRSPRVQPQVQQKKIYYNEKLKAQKLGETKDKAQASVHPTYKPPVVHLPPPPYRGPTYNCRVLNPLLDGRPSPRTDPSCKLKYPGFPVDSSCRCTYEVENRDVEGCATGFLYTCSRV